MLAELAIVFFIIIFINRWQLIYGWQQNIWRILWVTIAWTKRHNPKTFTNVQQLNNAPHSDTPSILLFITPADSHGIVLLEHSVRT